MRRRLKNFKRWWRLILSKEGIEKFQKAAEINTINAEAYYNWGVALVNLGRNEEAIEKFKKAVEINPKYADAYYNWGIALVSLGRNEEALEKYKKAVEINPNFSEAYVVLAMLNSILTQT